MSPHISSDDDPSLDLFTSGGEKWKRYRTIMNLTFTWTKIKEVRDKKNKLDKFLCLTVSLF